MRWPRWIFIVWLGTALAGVAQESVRTWTSHDGRTVEAELTGFDGVSVRLRLPDGGIATVPLSRLSAADQAYARQRRPEPFARPKPPEFVGVTPQRLALGPVANDPATGFFICRSPHFQIDSQVALSPVILREVAACLEAVLALFQTLPWDIRPAPPPDGRHTVTFFATMEAYQAAGGPAGSAGVYHSSGRRLLMPLESLGLKANGGRFERGADYKLDVLVHELSHQMMHFWLRHLPQWVIEGMAEYVRLLPYQNGRFHLAGASKGLRDHLEFRRTRVVGGLPGPYPVEKLFAMGREEWAEVVAGGGQAVQSLYLTSYLLVYYFMHLDGRGDGERFIRYVRASAEPARQREAYEKALEEFRRNAESPHPDGESSASQERPRRPHPPRELLFGRAVEERLRQHLQILLDGRSEAALMEAVRAAYLQFGLD